MVEDELRLADTVHRGLTDAGFVVEMVHDGENAVWAATEHSYDVIVLDIMLPKLNGYRVLEMLRARGIWTPVLMLTAKDGEYDQTDAFDLGADDYLTKPFSFLVLVARLRALIRRGGPERPVVLTAGDLTLDVTRRRVERNGREITLTPREYGLLEFLMRHRGDTVSKSEILAGVWDPAFDGDPNVVEVYVRYLRRKLELPGRPAPIDTLRSVGYRLTTRA